MGNSVATAKQGADKNFCSIDDVEICYKGLEETYTLTEDGDLETTKELYMGEAYPAYYYCQGCEGDWVINAVQTKEMAWKLVKEHLHEL